MMRVLEGVYARTDTTENVNQVVGLSGRTLIGLCYALGLKLKKWTIMKSNESQKQIVVL